MSATEQSPFARLHRCPLLSDVVYTYLHRLYLRLPPTPYHGQQDGNQQRHSHRPRSTSPSPSSSSSSSSSFSLLTPSSSASSLHHQYHNQRKHVHVHAPFPPSSPALSSSCCSLACDDDLAQRDDMHDHAHHEHYCMDTAQPDVSVKFDTLVNDDGDHHHRHSDIHVAGLHHNEHINTLHDPSFSPSSSPSFVIDRLRHLLSRSTASPAAQLHALSYLHTLLTSTSTSSSTSSSSASSASVTSSSSSSHTPLARSTLFAAVLGCVLVAAKWHDDDWARDNSFFAAVAGYPLSVVNAVERAVLALLDFRLSRSVDQLDDTTAVVFRTLADEKTIAAGNGDDENDDDDGRGFEEGDGHVQVLMQRLIALGVVHSDEYDDNGNDDEESDDEHDDALFPPSSARRHDRQQQQQGMHSHHVGNDNRSWLSFTRGSTTSALQAPTTRSIDLILYEAAHHHNVKAQACAQAGLYHHHKQEAVAMTLPSHSHQKHEHHAHSPAGSELSDCVDIHHHHVHHSSQQYAPEPLCRATDVLYCDDNFIL